MASPATKERAPQRARYEDDLYTWVNEQVALLRAGNLDEIDAENIAEELRAEFPSECPYTWDDLLERPFELDSLKK